MDATMLLIGSTGAVGSEVLRLALEGEEYSKVITLTRRPLTMYEGHPKLEQHIVDFERLEEYQHLMKARDVVSALGSTIKKAGSQERFFQIDHDYPLEIARLARANGAERFILVSSVGAKANSKTSNYLHVKGLLEQHIGALGYPCYVILRPSLLIGERSEKRWGEDIGKWLDSTFRFLIPKRYRGISVTEVARRIIQIGAEAAEGEQVYESEAIPLSHDGS